MWFLSSPELLESRDWSEQQRHDHPGREVRGDRGRMMVVVDGFQGDLRGLTA